MINYFCNNFLYAITMEDNEMLDKREDVFSRAVKAGKRTYFFDVKRTRGNEFYLTITESKRRFDNSQARFVYEKHKLFLYKEDFEKFVNGLQDVISFVETGEIPPERVYESENHVHHDVDFEELDKETPETK
jgi:hypothetical protein